MSDIVTKPAVSQQQWKWMFATGQPFARRWAHATPGGKGKRFRRLPVKVATKAYDAKAGGQIVGNLYRGNDGKFSAGASADAQAKETIARNKRLNAAAPKGGKGKGKKAGSKGKAARNPRKPVKTPEQRNAERLATQQANRATVKQALAQTIAPTGFDSLVALASNKPLDDAGKQALVSMGLARYRSDGSLALTTYGHQTMRAANNGDAQAAIDAVNAAPKRKSFTVYKSAAGQYRWLSVTTTAFEDLDGEIITKAALADEVARTGWAGDFGPLRWWHVGVPDGPGLDIGRCDLRMLSPSGLSLIESGTFADEQTAQAIATKADQYEVSPGFRCLPQERGRGKAYSTIRIFERSVVPRWAGRASNRLTAFTV